EACLDNRHWASAGPVVAICNPPSDNRAYSKRLPRRSFNKVTWSHVLMKKHLRRTMASLSLMVFASAFTGTVLAAPVKVTLYHNPRCMCCEQYADYLNGKGYDVKVLNPTAMAALNDRHGVKPELSACHT